MARDLFAEVFGGLDADSRPVETGPEPDVRQVLDAELYKARRNLPGEKLTLDGLIEAVDRTWDGAIDVQLGRDEFAVVRTIVDLADLGVLPAAHTLPLLELGEPVPETRSEGSHPEAFFPAAPDALSGGIDAELIEALQALDRDGARLCVEPVLHAALGVLDAKG